MIRIRLQRKGRRRRPIHHLVIADSRAPRDGRIIERVGRYDNVTENKEVVLNEERILYWLEKGAQPSDTVRKILRNSGLLYKRHLMMWGKSEEEIEAALAEWKSFRDSKSDGDASRRDTHKTVLAAEEKEFKKQVEQSAAEAAKKAAAKKAMEEEAKAEEKVADEAKAEEPAKAETAEEAKEEKPKAEKEKADTEEKVADKAKAEESTKAETAEEAKEEKPKAEKEKADTEEKVAEETKAEEPTKAETAEEAKEEEPKAEKEAAGADQSSADMTAKEAIDHIRNTDLADLKDFIAEDESRVTVLSAWESKQSDK